MKGEDIVEWFMIEQIRHYVQWLADLRRVKFEFQLQRVKNTSFIMINEMDSSSQVAVAGAGEKMKMVGLEEDLIEIKDQLCRGSRQLQILPITGMGGIGKTTLARNAYEDPLIMERFEIRVWITISQDYNEGRIVSELMKEFFPERKGDGFLHSIYFRHTQLDMPQLRHLIFLRKAELPYSRITSFALKNLQTLEGVMNLNCTVTNLNMFLNLKKLYLGYDLIWQTDFIFHNLQVLKLRKYFFQAWRMDY